MKNISKAISRGLLTVAVAGLGLALTPQTAGASYLDFTLDPSALGSDAFCKPGPGGGTSPCIADRLDGAYSERFTVTSFNPITGGGTFATEAYFDLNGFSKNEASEPLLGSGLNNDYGIYALFSALGSFAPNSQGGFDFIAASGSLDLYADLSLDSNPKVLPASAPGAVTVPNAGADDPALAHAILSTGEGHTTSSKDSGDFELLFDPFALTALGEAYFVKPVPFYTKITVRGVFDEFSPGAATNDVLKGVANAQFIPEPATLTLLGLGLFGFGIAARRRRVVENS